jgi:hypothetical protein
MIFGMAVAAMISLGGPVLWYLRSEFANGGRMDSGSFAMFGPIMGAFSLIIPGSPNRGWEMMGIVLATGVIAKSVKHVHDERCSDKLST